MPAIYPRPQDSVNNPLDHTNEEVQPKRDGDIFNLGNIHVHVHLHVD